ncbi:MAG: ornithine carbamoyltransferase [Candidatus Omnitrophica bacterium]|nr:ornithine carbamoyltransferase [Candidatus Omnitrophota bacterium]
MKKQLISVNDLSREDIEKIFALSTDVKKNPEKFQNALQGKMFGLIFEKPSTRTWVSFQAGIFSLGGNSIYLGPDDIKLGVREEVKDVARVLNRYLSGVVMRTFYHKTITEFGMYFRQPMINGLSDYQHPCQALADFFTIRERFGEDAKPIVTFVGDGNNVLNSLILLAAKLGGIFRYVTPEKHPPAKKVHEQAMKLAQETGAVIESSHDPVNGVRDADVVYTDVWVSMGQEEERAKKIKDFDGMQVNSELLKKAKKDVAVMHCLPAHRGEEITDEVMEGQNSIVFDQAENRLHVQKAILLHLCSAS